MNIKGTLVSYLVSPLSKIAKLENTSQFKLVKDLDTTKVKDHLINKVGPVTVYNNSLTFLDTDENFELQEDLLELITNRNYNVGLAKLSDKKILFDFAIQICFGEKALGIKSTNVESLIRLPKSPAIMGLRFPQQSYQKILMNFVID